MYASKIQSLSCLLFLAIFACSVSAGTVDSSDGGKPWENRRTKTVRAAKSPDERNRFGGWAKHKVAEPGFFRVFQKGRQWWLVDPDGYIFFSVGMNSVEADRVASNSDKQWAEETHQLLTGSGFNTIGRWSQPQAFKEIKREIPWCATLGFMKRYRIARGDSNSDEKTIPVFDKEWPAFCEKYATEEAPQLKDDRYLLGYFSDNELPFRPDALGLYLALPEDDQGHQGALAWMEENKVGKGRVDNPKVQAAFVEEVSRRYFETVAVALKKSDPNHLYLGSRLHGKSISEPVLRGANACDVVSINYYHRWTPEKKRTADWTKWSEKPFLVGEFYAMKVASKRTKADGAGFWVLSHEDAGEFYHTYTSAMLKEIPNCVGYHWFKYADAFDDQQKGIVSQKGEVHQTLVDAMKIVNSQTYSLRGYR